MTISLRTSLIQRIPTPSLIMLIDLLSLTTLTDDYIPGLFGVSLFTCYRVLVVDSVFLGTLYLLGGIEVCL